MLNPVSSESASESVLVKSALKEWSVAVDALAAGETILLLRKGGIKEHKGKFFPEAERVLLFPTFEHQKAELLKGKYQSAVVPVAKGWHPETIKLKAWADITHVFLTDDPQKVSALADFHIWQPQLAQERLKWKAKQPLSVLLLRVYRLDEPVALPWQATYGGCRSWLELSEPIELLTEGTEAKGREANAAIAASDYQKQVDSITSVLEG